MHNRRRRVRHQFPTFKRASNVIESGYCYLNNRHCQALKMLLLPHTGHELQSQFQ